MNDYSTLYPLAPEQREETRRCDLIVANSEAGICRVMCFSPRHDVTLATMPVAEIRQVIDVWAEQYQELGGMDWINHVQIFENRGGMMGASNPHPHCKIWANEHLPNEPEKELRAQRAYLETHRVCLLCNYLKIESEAQERTVYRNQHFVVVVPFWAIWPFEMIVIATHHAASLAGLAPEQRDGLADVLNKITAGFDVCP